MTTTQAKQALPTAAAEHGNNNQQLISRRTYRTSPDRPKNMTSLCCMSMHRMNYGDVSEVFGSTINAATHGSVDPPHLYNMVGLRHILGAYHRPHLSDIKSQRMGIIDPY